MTWLLRVWQFTRLHVGRTWAWDLRTVPLSPWEESRLQQRGIEEAVTRRYLAWRRSTLLLAGVATALYAAAHALVALEVYLMVPELWSDLGVAVQGVRYLALFSLPAASFVAFALWARPRLSRVVVLAGWAAAFLTPVLLSLVPPHRLFNLEAMDAQGQQHLLEELSGVFGVPITFRVDPETVTRAVRTVVDVAGGVVYGVLLLPTVVSLVPGVIRASLRVKVFLPGSVLPGWSLMLTAPVYCFAFLVVLVMVNQVTGSVLALASGLLFAAAPLVYVLRMPAFLRPATGEVLGRQLRAARLAYAATVLAATVFLGLYLGSVEVRIGDQTLTLVGLSEERSLLQPWDLLQFVVEYLGRSLFVTVAAADVIVRAQAVVWGYTAEFARSGASSGHDEAMRGLSRALGDNAAGAPAANGIGDGSCTANPSHS